MQDHSDAALFRQQRKRLARILEDWEEKRDAEPRESKSSSIMLSAVYRHVQQTFNFAGSSGVGYGTAELREHDHLVMLSEVQRSVQQISIWEEARAGR